MRGKRAKRDLIGAWNSQCAEFERRTHPSTPTLEITLDALATSSLQDAYILNKESIAMVNKNLQVIRGTMGVVEVAMGRLNTFRSRP